MSENIDNFNAVKFTFGSLSDSEGVDKYRRKLGFEKVVLFVFEG